MIDNDTQVTGAFLLSVPGRLARFAALSREERRAIYWGWWQTTKKEAYHYWVRGVLQWATSLASACHVH